MPSRTGTGDTMRRKVQTRSLLPVDSRSSGGSGYEPVNHIEPVKLHGDQCCEGDGDGAITGGSDC